MNKERGNALPNGSKVGKYIVEGLLGSGGFGITYLATDTLLDRKVALKECLPLDLAYRRGNMTVGPNSGSSVGDFQWAKDRFLNEAKTLAKFSHPNVVTVHDILEYNDTAYMATEYKTGQDLETWLQGLGRRPSEKEAYAMFFPLLDGLEKVHEMRFLHRDIKPENIYMTSSGTPLLLDFGSARQTVGNRSRPMTSIVTPGYAPFEQYHEGGDQGPWTDVYSLAAVMHRALTGTPPPEASRRERKDPYEPLVQRLHGHFNDSLLSALDKCLETNEQRRYRSVKDLRKNLKGGDSVEPAHGVLAQPPPLPKRLGQPESSDIPIGSPQSLKQPAPNSHQDVLLYAGFWKRVGAILIDGTMLSVITLAVLGILGVPEYELEDTFFGFSLVSWWIYFAVMESSTKQATLGKMALGIQVTTVDGNRIGFWRATGRHFSKWISAVILYIGFIMASFTEKKQGLHDIMTGCLVVNKSRS